MGLQRFDRAVERHQRKVYTLASYLLTDAAEAEDLTQEVFLKLWHHRDLWRSQHLREWLLRVTRNACVDRLRSRSSRARFLSSDPLDAAAARVAADGRDPEQVAVAGELATRVRHELASLSEPYRSVIVLREILGLSYQEITEVQGLSLSNVRVTLHRGRKLLRERLKGVRCHAAAC